MKVNSKHHKYCNDCCDKGRLTGVSIESITPVPLLRNEKDILLRRSVKGNEKGINQEIEAAGIGALTKETETIVSSRTSTSSSNTQLISPSTSHPLDGRVDSNQGSMSLYTACRFGIVKIAKEKATKVNVRQYDDSGMLPLHHAAERGQTKIIKALLPLFKNLLDSQTYPTLLRPTASTSLHLAAKGDYVDTIKELVKNGATVDVSIGGRTPLMTAIRSGASSSAVQLINSGANVDGICDGPDDEENVPLIAACENNLPIVVKALLDGGADPLMVHNEWSAAMVCCRSGSADCLKYIIKWAGKHLKKKSIGAGVHKNGKIVYRPLSLAARSGSIKCVRMLLKTTAINDINSIDSLYWTPLHYAAEGGYEQIIKLLLDAGADINSQDDEGLTPLHKASENGHLSAVNTLLDYSNSKFIGPICIDAKFRGHFTALHFAAQNGHMSIVKTLVAHNADIMAGSDIGWTPSQSADRFGHGSIAAFLREKEKELRI